MNWGSGLRHGSIAASLRPSPRAVWARSGGDPRFERYPLERNPSPASLRLTCRSGSRPDAFSPFVPPANDSESSNAHPSGTSLALPDRLAGDQQNRSLYAGVRSVRALPAPAWTLCRAACWNRWRLVGYRHRCLARRPRPAASSGAGLHSSRGDPHDAQARLSGDRPPQSRPDLQRAAVAQSRRALPALPHDPRWAGTSPAPVVECLSPSRVGRPFHRAIQLARSRCARRGQGTVRAFAYDRQIPPRCRQSSGKPRLSWHRAAAFSTHSRFLAPARRQSGGCRWAVRRYSGAQHDRSLSDPKDDRDGATSARR